VKPGQKIQLAIFGINGPISNPPTNYIYMRYATLEFHKVKSGPVALEPQEVNVEVVRLDPAIDAIVPANPKIFKVAEGFIFTEGPVWSKEGHFLFSDPNTDAIYKYAPDGKLSVFKKNSGYSGKNIPGHTRLASDGQALDQNGNLYVSGAGGLRIISPEGKHLGTIIAPKQPQHLAWGGEDGKTLYMAAQGTLYRMPLNVSGIRMNGGSRN
jgi:gluconolactonase